MWRRAGRLLKRTLIVLLGLSLVLAIGGSWLLESEWFESLLARELSERLEEVTGEDAVVGGVEVELSRRRLRVDGVLLTHRAPGSPNDGALILSIQSISVRPDWVDGQWVLEAMRIEQPFVRLHVDEDGIREFRNLAQGEGETEFPWDDFWISGATVEVIHGEDQARIEGLSIEPGEVIRSLNLAAAALEIGKGEHIERSQPWSIQDLRLDSDHIDAADISLEFPSFSIAGSVSLQDGDELHTALAGQAHLERLRDFLPAVEPVSGTVDWELVLSGELRDLAISGGLRSESLGIQGPKPEQSYTLSDVDSSFRVESGSLKVDANNLVWAESPWDIQVDLELLTGDYQLTADTEEVDILTLLEASRLPLQSRVQGKTSLSLSLEGGPDRTELAMDWKAGSPLLSVYSAPPSVPERLLIIDVPELAAEGSLELAQGNLAIEFASVESPLGSMTADLSMNLGEEGDLQLDMDLTRMDLAQLDPLLGLNLRGVAGAQGRVHGDWRRGLRFDGGVSIRRLDLEGVAFADTLSGRLESDDLKAWFLSEVEARKGASRYGGQVSMDLGRSAWLDIQLLLHEARISDLVQTVTELPGVEGEVTGSMTLEGVWNRLTGEIWLDLGQVDLYGETFEGGRLIAWMDAGQFTLEALEIWRAVGTESLLARGTIGSGWNMRMEVLGSGFHLEYLDHLLERDLAVRGRMSLDAQVRGTLMDPRPAGRLAVWDTWIQGWPVGDTFLYFDTDAREIEVHRPIALPQQLVVDQLAFRCNLGGDGLEIKGALPMASKGPWWMQMDLDGFPVQRLVPEAADGGRVKGQLAGDFLAWGRLEEPSQTSVEGQLERVAVVWAGHELENTTAWEYRQADGSFLAESIGLKGGKTDVKVQAKGDIGGESRLEGGGSLDLDLLRSLVGDLHQAEGEASVGIQGAGDWPYLDLHLDLDLSDGRFAGAWFPSPVEGMSGRLQASPDGYEMSRVEGLMGGGGLSLSGRIDADSWVPTHYDLHGEVKGSRVQMVDFLPPFIGDASLDFDGPVDELLLSGSIDILDMRFDERIDWEDWVIELQGGRLEGASSEVRGDYFALDIRIDIDETMRMRNNLADLTASGELRVIGDTARIGTIGDIRATPGGRVYLNEREFELVRAELHFIDPYSYDPEVDLALVTEVNTREEHYEIDYRIVGLYSDWRAETNSNPALPQADVHALLLFGMTRAELERYGGLGGALAAEGGDLLASKLVGSGIYQLDFVPVEIRPDRLDLVSSMGSRGLVTISSDVRFLAEWDLGWETTAILEQNLARGTDTYLGLEKRLARKLYARTYWAGEEYGRNTRLPGAVGMDFNLRWELD